MRFQKPEKSWSDRLGGVINVERGSHGKAPRGRGTWVSHPVARGGWSNVMHLGSLGFPKLRAAIGAAARFERPTG